MSRVGRGPGADGSVRLADHIEIHIVGRIIGTESQLTKGRRGFIEL